MKKLFFLPLLMLTLTVCSQTNDTPKKKHFKTRPLNSDSFAIKLQRMKDSAQKTMNDIQWENNMRNAEELMKTVEKREKKEKNKAILYIVIGVGMLLVLIFGLMRRKAERKV